MRLDASKEPEFASMFGEPSELPLVVVMNPGKRKRFLKHDKVFTSEDLTQTLDMILGGDAKFKAIKELSSLSANYDVYLQ